MIDGVKVACGACIRGHRSTKCDHYGSRVMIPVRKPGRPLTSCPHLQSQKCDCAKTKGCGGASCKCLTTSSLTVAFPKKSSCHTSCPPESRVKVENLDAQNMNDLPAALGDCRVRKPSQPLPQFTRVRPQSYDARFFEDLNMANVNVVNNSFAQPRPDIVQQKSNDKITNGNPRQPTLLPYATSSEQPPISPTYTAAPVLQQPFPCQTGYNSIQPFANDRFGFDVSNLSINPSNSNGMQHQSNLQANNNAQPILTQYPVGQSFANESPACSHGIHHSIPSNCSSSNGMQLPATNGISQSMSPSQDPFSMTNNHNHNGGFLYNGNTQQQPNPYQPSQIGSHLNPLQPQIWQQQFANSSNNLGQISNQQSQPNPQDIFFSEFGTIAGDCMGGACMCGPGCQCIMCASHPYNETMVQHIASLYQPSDPLTPAVRILTNGKTTPPFDFTVKEEKSCCSSKKNEANSVSSLASGGSHLPGTVSPDTEPSTTSTPDNGSTGEHQQLNPEDFLFVEYQLDGIGACAGEELSCLCGDGCECPGCSLHQVPDNGGELKDDTLIGMNQPVMEATEPKKSCCSGK